jgi:hypothetical protein
MLIVRHFLAILYVINHNLGVVRKMKWCKGEYTIFYLYLKVRKKIPYKVYDTDFKLIVQKKKVFRFKMLKILPSK